MATTIPRLDVPRFSLAERERRWGKVRQLMDREGIDVLVAPSNTGGRDGLQANVRYLTGIGVNSSPVAAVFPRHGDVTALTGPVPYAEYWLGFQDWVTDIRAKFFSEGDAIVERLRELSIDRGRIGIAGLADVPRMPDGIVPHGLYMKIRNAFPNNAFMPTPRKLQQGDIITSEVEAHWGGYVGQVTITGAIGKVPSDYADMHRIQQDIIDQAYEHFRPGISIGELLRIGEEATQGTPYQSRMIMHSRGLGNDAPIAVFGTRDQRIRNWRIEENAVFVIKPVVMTGEWVRSVSWGGSVIGGSQSASVAESGARTVCWGDSVVATPSGARRLGKRPRNFIEID